MIYEKLYINIMIYNKFILIFALFVTSFVTYASHAESKIEPIFQQNYPAKALKALDQPATLPATADPAIKERVMQNMQASSLLFIENKGQIIDDAGNLHPEILFKAQGNGTQIYVTATSIHYVFTKVEKKQPAISEATGQPMVDNMSRLGHEETSTLSTQKFTVSLLGANDNPELVKDEAQTFEEHYYLGHCPDGIVAHSYERFTLKNVYPGVDWVVYSNGKGFKYDFVAANPAAAKQIKLKVDGAKSSISKEGELIMETQLGSITEDKPVSFQNGKALKTSFTQSGNGTYGFDLKGAIKDAPITIDPSVSWATYYGGGIGDEAYSNGVDASRNVYMAGKTNSTNFPTANAFQSTNSANYDAYLVKFDGNGNRLRATYYGGNANEVAYSCAIDASGNVSLAGETNSTNFPTSGAFQSNKNASKDAFIVKFAANGNRLWATYYGGNSEDEANSCAVDASGNVYITGETFSTNFPVLNAFQSNNGGSGDAFCVKFSSAGNRLWATYFGGSRRDEAHSCAIDASGNVYITGETFSNNFPVFNGFQSNLEGASDAFIVQFNLQGLLSFSTYYGGNGD